MEIDDYLSDSQRFIKLAAPHINEGMTDNATIQGAILFAIGVEKLLKFTLARVNPVFILTSPDFRHAAPALYRRSFVTAKSSRDIVDDKPDDSVLAFRPALGRLRQFSKAANDHHRMLFTLANARDVIAHRPTSELELRSIARMLMVDAYVLLEDFSAELGVACSSFFGDDTVRLAAMAQRLAAQEQLEISMAKLLEEHRLLWLARSVDETAIRQALLITNRIAATTASDHSFEQVICPACGQVAIVRVEADFDYEDGASYLNGVYAANLHCHYCDLNLDEYEQLDFVDVDRLLATFPE